jgi:hypothetical protein
MCHYTAASGLSCDNTDNGEIEDYLANIKTAPAPIELISFNGKCDNNEVQLNWITATETNNDYFTIQKSKDCINYEDIGTIKGSGNSISNKYYTFKDIPYENRLTFYRLKQTDFDGNYTHSKTISTDCSDATNYFVYYNPASNDGKKITIQIYTNKVASCIVKIYDISGREIVTLLNGENIEDGFHTYTYDCIKSGVYIVKSVINDKTHTSKVIFF